LSRCTFVEVEQAIAAMHRHFLVFRSLQSVGAAAAFAVLLAGCGDSPSPTPNPNQPTPQGPHVVSITPTVGSTLGGTPVTITGANFAAGATVAIGGSAATTVVVEGPTTITAMTGQHTSGAGDVVVTVAGMSGTLPGGFTFAAPELSANSPPTIASIAAQTQRRGAPRNFADLDDVVDLTAFVADSETPLSQLTYEWTADAGAFDGSGPAVRWRAPSRFQTPADVSLTLTVIERYDSVDPQGLPVTAENRVSSAAVISLHDSRKELGDLAYDFLVDFSRQVSPQTVVRNFTSSCPGSRSELRDVEDNQATKTITSYSIGTPDVVITFGGFCRERGRFGDGCAYVPVRWQSIIKADGRQQSAVGIDQVNGLFEGGRWQLCDSDFVGTTTINGVPSAQPFKK
jgi:hypothetical protein